MALVKCKGQHTQSDILHATLSHAIKIKLPRVCLISLVAKQQNHLNIQCRKPSFYLRDKLYRNVTAGVCKDW